MRRPVGTAVITLAALLAGAEVWAQPMSQAGPTPWLHVRVTERGDASANVSVNLPLSAVEAVVALMPERVMSRGRVRLHRDHELSVRDLRRLWDAVRDTGDSPLVTMDSDDGELRVGRIGDVIQIRFEGRDDGEAKSVRAEIPVDVVDALLSGDDDTLDLAAAIDRLKDRRGDLIRITDGAERVHVWIDERQQD